MSFQAEQKLVRLRPRAGRLVLPTLVLGLAVGAMSFAENLTLEAWQSVSVYAVASVLIFFAWLVPVVRQLVAWVEVSTGRLVWRDGLFGQKRREVSWHEVSGVEYARGKISVFVHGQETLVLKGLPKGKQIAREMQNLVRG